MSNLSQIIDDELQRRHDAEEAAQIPCAACGEDFYEDDMIEEKWENHTYFYCVSCYLPIE